MYKILFVLTFLVTGMDYGLLWKEELQNTNHKDELTVIICRNIIKLIILLYVKQKKMCV